MRETILMIIFFWSIIVISFTGCSINERIQFEKIPCKDFGNLPKKVFLNRESDLNKTALIYFNHPESDTSLRIWYWEHMSIDSGGTYIVNLFEYGLRKEIDSDNLKEEFNGVLKRQYAYHSSFEIEGRGDNDLGWNVICVKTLKLQPKNGWSMYYKNFMVSKLNEIYNMPQGQSGSANCSTCHTSLEYIFGDTIFQVDYSAKNSIRQSNYPRDVAFLELMDLIKKEFNLEIGIN